MDASGSPRPLGPLILLIVGVLVALAIFWVGFMLAPAAVLLISYLALSAGERARHQQSVDPSPLEPTAETGGSTARSGAQIGTHRAAEARTQREAQPPAESELVQAGSVGSQPRGART